MLLRTCKVVGVAEEWEHCAEGTSGLEGLVRVFLTEVRTLQSLETALHGATETGASTACEWLSPRSSGSGGSEALSTGRSRG